MVTIKHETKKQLKSEKIPYNSRLIKAGALLEEMRLLVRHWSNGSDGGLKSLAVVDNLLGKATRARAQDIFRSAFLPRYVKGRPPKAWKILRALEDAGAPVEVLKPVYYWVTARNEPILRDYVTAELAHKNGLTGQIISPSEVSQWIEKQLRSQGKTWSDRVTILVARGILATLRDFGILEGAVKKRLAPVYIPIESFAYMAFALCQEGSMGEKLVRHDDWLLFFLSPEDVEGKLIESDVRGFLKYQSAGRITRIDFPARSFEEMAHVVLGRTD